MNNNETLSQPKVSVIIPVYKREQYLYECFNSVVNQTLKDIEIIIVDKAEYDSAREIIDLFEKKDPRVIAPHIKNNGYGASCNIGLSIAKGEYILIVESDDYISPKMCEEMYSYAKSLDADVLKTPYVEFFNSGRMQDCPHKQRMATYLPEGKCFAAKDYGEIFEIHASLWSCIYKKEYLDKKSIRFIEADGAGYVDVGFRIDTFTQTERMAWLDKPYYYYRVDSSNSSSNTWNVSAMNQRWREVHEKFSSRQSEYDKYYGPYLIVDEYINTIYRSHISPLSESELEEIEYNFSFVKEEMIKKTDRLTAEQKEEILKFKRNGILKNLNKKEPEAPQVSPDIKIFVSHRIDQDAETINNPLFVPVRCGAVYDKRKNISMLGDNTGDNISNKRSAFCELTVQYWAWKNVQADYYGLCHYRRFISFADNVGGFIDDHGELIENDHLSSTIAQKYGLTDVKLMESEISKYDAIAIKTVDISQIPTPSGYHNNIYDFWRNGCINLIESSVIDKVLDLISSLHPEYYEVAVKYFSQNRHRGYNTFILRKELFFELCNFEFDILFALEKELDPKNYSNLMLRTPGYIGEILSAIFLYKIQKEKKYKFTSKQLVAFPDCLVKETKFLTPAYKNNNIPIVFVSSKYNLLYLSVCITSMLQHISDDNNYDIIILSSEIGKEDLEKLKAVTKNHKNVSVRTYNPYNIIPQQDFKVNIAGYISLPYYKALLPWILPFYSDAIVLDSDIIIKTDIAQLLDIDWGTNQLAAVRDSVFMGLLNGIEAGWLEYAHSTLHLTNPYNYINAGVLVMNMENIRSSMVAANVMATATQSNFKLADQDLINVVFQNKIHFLDCKWNHFVETNWWVRDCINASSQETLTAYKEAALSPAILHYANSPKPWNQPELVLADEWWSVARTNPQYEEILVRLFDEKLRNAIASIPASSSVQQVAPLPYDGRSGMRKFADKILPMGTKRRSIAKFFLPKGSLRWRICKQIYYIFCPQYRPKKEEKLKKKG